MQHSKKQKLLVMKRTVLYISAFCLLTAGWSCRKDYLTVIPQAQLSATQLQNLAGIESSLISAYTMLNGNRSGAYGTYASAPDNWVFGEIAADNAHKGSDAGDVPEIFAVETHASIPTNPSLKELWQRRYEGILRCNNTLKLLAATKDVNGTPRGVEIAAEARFLRAHYYFDLWNVFKYVPYVTDTTANPSTVPNDRDIITDIEADMLFAEQNLPVTKPLNQVGRADKIAAEAYLGKIYLYEKKYDLALPLFNDVIASRPDLTTLDFRDNFDVTKRNGPETIFGVQNTVNDGTNGSRGNVGDILNAPFKAGLPVSCCGFFSPSFDLVNAYRVDGQGLPDFDNLHTSYFPSSFDPSFEVPTTMAVDPRLDYTVGRQGIPYRDWGVMEGNAWVRNPGNNGPFVPYKNVTDAAQIAAHTQAGITNINDLIINIIRLADVYLMAAECAAQTDDLHTALTLVNKVRARAANLPAKQIEVGGVTMDAADYKVGQYPDFPDLDYAMKAIQWERRLELAMEGFRFNDLRRWGILQSTLAAYAQYESQKLNFVVPIASNDYYYPIPQSEIDNTKGVLKQH
jgi:hypothetical protein